MRRWSLGIVATAAAVPMVAGTYLVLFASDLLPRSLSQGNGPRDLDTNTLGPGLVLVVVFGSIALALGAAALRSTDRHLVGGAVDDGRCASDGSEPSA